MQGRGGEECIESQAQRQRLMQCTWSPAGMCMGSRWVKLTGRQLMGAYDNQIDSRGTIGKRNLGAETKKVVLMCVCVCLLE